MSTVKSEVIRELEKSLGCNEHKGMEIIAEMERQTRIERMLNKLNRLEKRL